MTPERRASRPTTTGPGSSPRANASAKRMSTGGVSESPTTPRTPATEIMRELVMRGLTIREGAGGRKTLGRGECPDPFLVVSSPHAT